MRFLSTKEAAWIGGIGLIASLAAFWLMARTVHSSELLSNAALAIVLPFLWIGQQARELPGWLFWLIFAVLQFVYLSAIYIACRSIFRRGSMSKEPGI